MIDALLAAIVPTFGIIGVGWLARRTNIWKEAAVDVLSKYAYAIALPALIFKSVFDARVILTATQSDLLLIGGVVAAHLGVFIFIAFLLHGVRASRELRGTAPMLVTFGSTAYLGIPFATFTFDGAGTLYASLLSVALVLVLLTTSIITMTHATRRRLHHSTIATLVELPFLWAVFVGLLLPVIGIATLPLFLSRTITILAESAGPTALLGLGAFLFGIDRRMIPWRRATTLGFLKIALPMGATAIVLTALGVSGVAFGVGLAMAGTSTSITSFVLAERYGVGERLVAGTILASTFFSFIALSIVGAVASVTLGSM